MKITIKIKTIKNVVLRPMEQAQAHRRGDSHHDVSAFRTLDSMSQGPNPIFNVSNQFSFKLINSKIKLISSKRKK